MSELETNEMGAAGSKMPGVMYRLDSRALLEIAAVMQRADAKYKTDQWRAISVWDHLNHGLHHVYRFLEPGQQRAVAEPGFERDELSHAACRLLMALAVYLQNPGVEERVPRGVVEPATLELTKDQTKALVEEMKRPGAVVLVNDPNFETTFGKLAGAHQPGSRADDIPF